MDRAPRDARSLHFATLREAYHYIFKSRNVSPTDKRVIKRVFETRGIDQDDLDEVQVAVITDAFGFIFNAEGDTPYGAGSTERLAFWTMYQKSESIQRKVKRILGYAQPRGDFDSGRFKTRAFFPRDIILGGLTESEEDPIDDGSQASEESETPKPEPKKKKRSRKRHTSKARIKINGIELINEPPDESFDPDTFDVIGEYRELAREHASSNPTYAHDCAVYVAQANLELYHYWFGKAKREAEREGLRMEETSDWKTVRYHQQQIDTWTEYAAEVSGKSKEPRSAANDSAWTDYLPQNAENKDSESNAYISTLDFPAFTEDKDPS